MHRPCHLVVSLAVVLSPLLGPAPARATDVGAPLPDAAAADLSADAATADAGAGETGVSADATPSTDGESGCGCTLGRATPDRGGGVLLLLLLLGLLRRSGDR